MVSCKKKGKNFHENQCTRRKIQYLVACHFNPVPCHLMHLSSPMMACMHAWWIAMMEIHAIGLKLVPYAGISAKTHILCFGIYRISSDSWIFFSSRDIGLTKEGRGARRWVWPVQQLLCFLNTKPGESWPCEWFSGMCHVPVDDKTCVIHSYPKSIYPSMHQYISIQYLNTVITSNFFHRLHRKAKQMTTFSSLLAISHSSLKKRRSMKMERWGRQRVFLSTRSAMLCMTSIQSSSLFHGLRRCTES